MQPREEAIDTGTRWVLSFSAETAKFFKGIPHYRARACRLLWEQFGADLGRLLSGTGWGERMLAMEFGSDIEVCAQVEVTAVVPLMEGGRITLGCPLKPSGG